MKNKRKHTTMYDALKAYKKASREEEIKLHGKPISYTKIIVSKKVYNRNKNKFHYDN